MLGERLERATAAFDDRARPLVESTRKGRLNRWLRWGGLVPSGLIVALFAFGVVTMGTMLLWWPVALGVPLLALLPFGLEKLPRRLFLPHALSLLVVTVAVALMTLLGIDVIWASADARRPSPAIGLVFAGIAMGSAAYGYLRWVGKEPPRRYGLWAAFAAIAGLALYAITTGNAPPWRLVVIAAVVGATALLYLRQPAAPEVKHPLWWALLLVGVLVVLAPLLVEAIKGNRTNVIILIAGAVIVAFAGLNGLWLHHSSTRQRHIRRVVGIGLVILALPLGVWGFLNITSTTSGGKHETMLPPAVESPPLPRAAITHRPIVLFDGGERFRTPVDVDAMLKTGEVELCPEGDGLLAGCRKVKSADDLRNGFGNLRFDTQKIENRQLPTTIYANVVRDQLNPGWKDIDYWWYLTDNPADTGQGAMCGAGFVIPEITCFDHQSDWEGVTIVVDEHGTPQAVHYAAHDRVVNVGWSQLQDAARGPVLGAYARGRDVANRPLVFVARGTHAAYPLPCRSAPCDSGTGLEENSHDGSHEWPERKCSSKACVKPFPRPASGVRVASWNAFDGYWGSAVCITKGFYCARSNGPRAPGSQPRYKHPWCYDYKVSADLRRLRSAKPTACEPKP